MTGMNAPKKTRIAMPLANGTPSSAATRPMPIASAAATRIVARVKAELAPGDDARRVDLGSGGLGEEAHHPRPDAIAVVEEEEEGEHRDEEAGDGVADRDACLGGAGAELVGLTGRLGAGRLDPLVQLGRRDPEGVHDPGADLVIAGADLRADVGELVGELRPDEGQYADEDRERAQHGEPGRQPTGHDLAQPAMNRGEEGGQQERDDDRDDELGERGHQIDDAGQGGRDDNDAPGPFAGGAHSEGDRPFRGVVVTGHDEVDRPVGHGRRRGGRGRKCGRVRGARWGRRHVASVDARGDSTGPAAPGFPRIPWFRSTGSPVLWFSSPLGLWRSW